ncbi:MAG TPA: PilZ domain-containing protein [Polyangiaceae bacterium]
MDRRCSDRRIQVEASAELVAEGGTRFPCHVTDVSLGGARAEIEAPLPFGSAVVMRLRLPGSVRELVLPAVVRWARGGAVGLQFGLLGARETHLITSLAVERAQTLGGEDVAWIG